MRHALSILNQREKNTFSLEQFLKYLKEKYLFATAVRRHTVKV